jgi:NADPH-dependent ferric siderophore reductase
MTIESDVEEQTRIKTFIASVKAVEQIGPRMVQITVGGGDLVRYEPLGPDQFVYVLAAPAGRDRLTIDSDFRWSQYEHIPPEDRPVGAYYTVRRWRREVAEIDLVVVTHGDKGEGSRWARRAAPADPVALWGPRRVYDPPSGTDRYVLVGDETGVHAIAAILEQLPEDVVADVVVEVDGPEDRVRLRRGPNTSFIWRYRAEAAPGTTSYLIDAVRDLDVPTSSTYAWGGAESKSMTAIRRYLRDRVGLPHERVAMTAYWRR